MCGPGSSVVLWVSTWQSWPIQSVHRQWAVYGAQPCPSVSRLGTWMWRRWHQLQVSTAFLWLSTWIKPEHCGKYFTHLPLPVAGESVRCSSELLLCLSCELLLFSAFVYSAFFFMLRWSPKVKAIIMVRMQICHNTKWLVLSLVRFVRLFPVVFWTLVKCDW